MDFTRLQTFRDCPERFRLRYLESLSKIKDDQYDAPAKFGQAIHAGLQRYYTHSMDATDSNVAFLAAFPQDIPNELCRTQVNGLKLLEAYHQYWRQQDAKMTVLGVEVVDQIDIGSYEPWQVKIDLVVETPNGIWGMDHKTTGSALSEAYWRRFEPNSQVSGYLYYLQQKYGQVSGFIINGIRVGYRQRAYKGEPAGFHWEFQRQYFNRTQTQLEDWRVRTLVTMDRMKEVTSWEKNESQCGYCSYRELCMSVGDPSVRETLYEQIENPLAYLGESHG